MDTRPVTAPRSAVRRLATARIISITGGAAAYTALNFTILQETGSAAWVAVSLLLTFGVTGFVVPPAGILGDRFDRRKVLIASDLAGAACFAMMAVSSEPAWLLPWAFLSAVAEAPFWSASDSAIPSVAGPELTTWANSLLSASRLTGVAIGPALGGLLLAATSPSIVFGLNAISFILSALIIVTVHARFSDERAEDEEEYRGIRAGFRYLRHERVLRTLLLAWIVFISGMGMSMVADAPLAEFFGAGSFGFGVLITAWGGGSALGSLYAKRMRKGGEGTWLVRAGGVIAATGIGIGVSPWFALAVALMFVMGLADGTTLVAETNLRQRRAPDAVRSRVTAAFSGVMHLALAFSYILAAFVVPWVGPKKTYVIGGVTAGLAVFVLLRMKRYLEQDEAAETGEQAA